MQCMWLLNEYWDMSIRVVKNIDTHLTSAFKLIHFIFLFWVTLYVTHIYRRPEQNFWSVCLTFYSSLCLLWHSVDRGSEGAWILICRRLLCCVCCYHFDGLMQERRTSSALAKELRLSCTHPSISLCTRRFMWCISPYLSRWHNSYNPVRYKITHKTTTKHSTSLRNVYILYVLHLTCRTVC